MYGIIWVGFKFSDFSQNHQFAKSKTSPKFPAIWYVIESELLMYLPDKIVSFSMLLLTFT